MHQSRRADRFGRIPVAALCLALLGVGACAELARADGATVMGWGNNARAGIGTGSATTEGCECIPAPQPVVGVSGVTQVAAGREHTLALLSNGTVLAWGGGLSGQLGDGAMKDDPTPSVVPGLTHVVAIAASEEVSLALLADGTVKGWGENVNGVLGRAMGPEKCSVGTGMGAREINCSRVPVLIPGLSNIVAISAGGAYELALRADGTVLAWGFDAKGTLGDAMGSPDRAMPAPVPGISDAVAISAGEDVASALLADGTVVDWGENDHGGLGTGGTEVASPSCDCLGPVAVKGLVGDKSVALGSEFGLTLLSAGGAVSWGLNGEGELGNGTTTLATTDPCRCLPTPGPVSQLSDPLALAAGEVHGLALLPDGGVMAWGKNGVGQLGIGAADQKDHPKPTQLLLSGASGIFAGADDSFALIGPTHHLSVAFAGADAGEGTVGGAGGLLCPPSCSAGYPEGQVVSLRGEGRDGKRFAGFSGGCSGAEACMARLDADKTVIATFGVPTGTKIARAQIKAHKGTATFQSTAPGAITGFQCMLVRPRAHGKSKHPKPRFARCSTRKTYKHLAPGRYAFKVRALDRLGHDARPAVKRFRISVRG